MDQQNPRRPAAVSSTGSTQAGRAPAALDPAYVRVDERDLADLLVFATQYAELITYYDLAGNPAADWSAFFDYDTTFLLAELGKVDIDRESAETLAFERALTGNDGGRSGPTATLEKEAIDALYRSARRLDEWYRRAVNIGQRAADGNRIRAALESVIRQDLGPHYFFLRQNPRWNAWLGDRLADDGYEFDPLWTLNPPQPARGARVSHLERLIDALHAFDRVDRTLVQEARRQLRESLERPDHPPHTALYIAFAKLLRVLQDDLNRFTERHLDYYYHDVLKLAERAGVPDRAHVWFRLAKPVAGHELRAGTPLRAGKDASGREIRYAIDEDVYLSKARIAALKTLFVAAVPNGGSGPYSTRVTRILACPAADSEDGLGQPLKDPNLGWPILGREAGAGTALGDDALQARLGLLVASPVLLLTEGTRDIRLSFRFTDVERLDAALAAYLEAGQRSGHLPAVEPDTPDTRRELLQNLLADAFRVSVSGPDGWRPVGSFRFSRRHGAAPCVDLDFRLEPKDAALVEARPDPHGLAADPPRPGLRLLLNPNARVYAYSFFKDLAIGEISLKVEVQGLAGAELNTGLGPITAGQPFPPFGAVPLPGAFLEIAHWELAQKPLEELELAIDWLNLPADFAAYYRGYEPAYANDSFKARLLIRSEGVWREVYRQIYRERGETPFRLFAEAPGKSGKLAPRTAWRFDFRSAPPEPLAERGRPPAANPAPPAVLRLELAEPAEAFGHGLYSRVLARAAFAGSTRAAAGLPPEDLPNPPFVPQAKAIAISYAATVRLVLDRPGLRAESDPPGLHLFHIGPFGHSDGNHGIATLFSPYEDQGYLYLGLAELDPPQTLTLLFHLLDDAVADLSEDAADRGDAGVRWSFLTHQGWRDFEKSALIKDGTLGLTRSGLVKLAIPREAATHCGTLPQDFHWLRASVGRGAESRPYCIGVHTQAATATRVPAAGATAGGVLPAGSLKEFAEKRPAVAEVHQPFATTGGRPAESQEHFRTRIGERLRHKQRAIQPYDYERIVLDAFPEIGQAKCVAWNNSRDYRTDPLPPGEVMLVAVPARDAGAASASPTPRVPRATLRAIEALLARQASPFVARIQAVSPRYERVKLFVRAVLEAGFEIGPTVRRLNGEINAFLAPWRGDPRAALDIGGGIGQGHRLEMFIAGRPYVRQVVALTLLHTYPADGGYRTAEWPPAGRGPRDFDAPIRAAAPWAVLVPAEEHAIEAADPRREEPERRWPVGVGQLEVGVDLILGR
jgi:hypothetical protein